MPRASGTPRGRDPASSTAARGWPRRSTGAAAHEPELNDARARLPRRRAAPRASPLAAPPARACSPASRRCSCSPSVAGVGRARAARQRARRRRPTADAQRLGARALAENDSTARCCSRARASRSTTRAQTRGNLLAALIKSPAAHRRAARRRRAHLSARAEPRRAHAWPPATPPATCSCSTRGRAGASRRPTCSRATGGSSSSPTAPTAAGSRSPTTTADGARGHAHGHARRVGSGRGWNSTTTRAEITGLRFAGADTRRRRERASVVRRRHRGRPWSASTRAAGAGCSVRSRSVTRGPSPVLATRRRARADCLATTSS